MIIALAGNQNCGKTTVFNQLTGANAHVGNFPGVTVESKEGLIRGTKDISLVDLPGIYSLSPFSAEEIVTRDFLLNDKISAMINVVDATNIERNLYLTMQLIELNVPMVIALNMMDEMRANGSTVNIKALSEEIGVPVVPISAAKNEGLSELIETVIDTAKSAKRPKRQDFCSGAVHRAIHAIAHLVEDHAERIHMPPRFAATKLVEGDDIVLAALALSENEKDMLEHSVTEMETELGTDREAAMADMRYEFIDKLCQDTVKKAGVSKAHARSLKMDEILTNKILALPIFICIMIFIFWVTFGPLGSAASNAFTALIDSGVLAVDNALTSYGINPVVHSLVIDGVFAGVGSVLSFLPIIVILFFFLSMLEDGGYMARVAFVMDKPLRKIGLSGRSFVPMIIGFGCTVPAVMATRTLNSNRDRKMTILLTPFMSCSAKLPIYAMFMAAFFPTTKAFVMVGLYVMGIALAIFCGILLNHTTFKGNPVPFVMELPNYRMPSAKSTGLLLWDKAKDFLTRAFTVIFIGTIIIWFLQTFDLRFNIAADSSVSMLAAIGRLISPIFEPMGFGNWMSSTALVTGFAAKESVISTLAVLTGGSLSTLPETLSVMFSTQTAWAFLTFTLAYTPCIAAISAIKRELGSGFYAFLVVVYQTVLAWLASYIVYLIAGAILG